jgi:hypothetical protein
MGAGELDVDLGRRAKPGRFARGAGSVSPASLRRLVLTFDRDGIQVRTLYRRKHGPSPNTKARSREVAELAREGLERALKALEEDVVVDLGTSGFEMREDVLGLPTTSPDSGKLMKKGA